MKKILIAIIIVIILGFILNGIFFSTPNEIKLYKVDIDSCCTYSIRNYTDNAELLSTVLEKVYNDEYPTYAFITNLKEVNYSDGMIYTNGKSDLLFFEKYRQETDKFSFVSIYLLEKSTYDLQQESHTDSCAVYLGSFNDLNFKALSCALNEIKEKEMEVNYETFSYFFFNQDRRKCIEVFYTNRGKCFGIKIKDQL